MFDPYQVYEARAWGADAILIIMACFPTTRPRALEETALGTRHGRAVEVHDEAEMERALALSSPPARHQQPRSADLRASISKPPDGWPDGGTRTACWSARAASSRMPIASGSQKAGIGTFLVGESLMRQADVAAATRALLGACAGSNAARVTDAYALLRLTHLGAAGEAAHGRCRRQGRDRAHGGGRRRRDHEAGDAGA